jgi:hypothetical protein
VKDLEFRKTEILASCDSTVVIRFPVFQIFCFPIRIGSIEVTADRHRQALCRLARPPSSIPQWPSLRHSEYKPSPGLSGRTRAINGDWEVS